MDKTISAELELESALRQWWTILDETLYIKQGEKTQYASRFYTHRDPAGTIHWARDHVNVSKKEFALLVGWSDTVAPEAKGFQEDYD